MEVDEAMDSVEASRLVGKRDRSALLPMMIYFEIEDMVIISHSKHVVVSLCNNPSV